MNVLVFVKINFGFFLIDVLLGLFKDLILYNFFPFNYFFLSKTGFFLSGIWAWVSFYGVIDRVLNGVRITLKECL